MCVCACVSRRQCPTLLLLSMHSSSWSRGSLRRADKTKAAAKAKLFQEYAVPVRAH